MTSSSLPTVSWWRSTSVVRAVGVLAPLVVCLLLAGLRSSVPAASAVLLLVLLVVAVAATGDRLGGVVAAVSSGVWFDFFLTEPYNRLAIDDPDDIQAAVLLVLIGLAVTELALWGRRQQEQAARRSGYLDGVMSAAASVAQGQSGPEQVVDVVAAHIADVLGADMCRYVAGRVRDPRVALLDHDGVLTQDGHQRDVDRTGLPVDEYVAIEVRRGSRVIGHFEIVAATRSVRPSREQCRVAVLVADQVAHLVDQ